MCIALRQCAAPIWKYVRPFAPVFIMISVSRSKSTYDHSTNKVARMYHTFMLFETVVPLYMIHAQLFIPLFKFSL